MRGLRARDLRRAPPRARVACSPKTPYSLRANKGARMTEVTGSAHSALASCVVETPYDAGNVFSGAPLSTSGVTKRTGTMSINESQLRAVLALPGPKRYAHLIKRAVDERKVWGLYSDGWALANTDDGTPVFPVWPGAEYAGRCAAGSWQGYEAAEIDLDDLLEELIPKLKGSGTLIGVFPTPSEQGVTPSFDEFVDDLRTELERIE